MEDVIKIRLRSEKKFYISFPEYFYLKQIVQTVMTPDPYMRDKGQYYVRSLYFDTVDNVDFYSKLSGIEERKKIRLRIYDTSSDKVKLEVKNRRNEYISKESILISKEDAIRIINGQYSCLNNYDGNVAVKVQNYMSEQLYTPKVVVDYDREAFVYPEHNVRITFDKSIRCSFSDSLFEKTVGMVPVFREPKIVMEVKYDQILPDFIKKAISTGQMQGASISKYCMAREVLV